MQSHKKKKYLAVAVIAAAVAFAYYRGHSGTKSKPPAPSVSAAAATITVGTQVAASSKESQVLVLSGRVVAQDALRVGTELGAVKVAQVLVDVGQKVTKGQVLARLDTRLLSSALQSASANMRVITQQVESAKAQATEAKAALSRAEKVEGALSKEAFAQRRTAMETTAAAQAAAEAQLEAAAAAAADARTKLDYSSIVSPADGIVSIRNIAAGEVVSSANNPLFVVDSNTREIEVDLSSTQRESLSDLSRAAIPGKDVSLKLRWISPEVYASGNTARARFALTGKETLTPGTRVSLRLSLAEREAIRLPLRALQKTDKGWQAFVVKDGKAVGRPVAVQEPILGNSVAIESGVSVGDHVVVDGADFVADGMAVTEAGSPR